MTKEERLKKRHSAEKRFRFYGLASIFVALLFVLILVQNIFSKGSSAFKKTVIKTEVFYNQELLELKNGASEKDIINADFYEVMIESLIKSFPAKNIDEENELIRLFSADAEYEIKKAFLNNNNLIGEKIILDLTASDDIDQLHKGNYPRDLPEDRRRISNFQLAIYDNFVENDKISKNFNNYYGSPFLNIRSANKNNVYLLFDIDWKGARKIRKNFIKRAKRRLCWIARENRKIKAKI